MSKLIQPFGKLTREIVVKADHKGLVIVEAWDYTDVVTRGFRPTVAKTPMDSRHMVLALQKIVMDYCAVMFQTIGGTQQEGTQQSNEQEEGNNHKTDS